MIEIPRWLGLYILAIMMLLSVCLFYELLHAMLSNEDELMWWMAAALVVLYAMIYLFSQRVHPLVVA